MESVIDGPVAQDDFDLKSTASTENFQKFIYELFEKNGIMSDLRAYLRGHIVNILKNSQTGSSVTCQKKIQERLDLKLQAFNILIAEYLLQLEFRYTLSVFVSEIPLANMVFDFAKSLLKKVSDDTLNDLRLSDTDVWHVLSYIGLKCDSEHASHILKSYRKDDNTSLLLCIMESTQLYRKDDHVISNDDSSDGQSSNSCSDASTDSKQHRRSHMKCRHLTSCKHCRKRLGRLRARYRNKKRRHVEQNEETQQDDVDKLMRNMNVIEKDLIEEMFQQMKSVYESELAMVKAEEEKKIRNSITLHALYLKKKTAELEDAYQARESELETTIRQKKEFLVTLAKTLRNQHSHLSNAMSAVRDETRRLSNKEESLKAQLGEAEKILEKRAEDMRAQISSELHILENHLECMKKERQNIQRERTELESLKCGDEPKIKTTNIDSCEHFHEQYDIMRNELSTLKSYLESSRFEPKRLVEQCTVTELCDVTVKIGPVLNNDAGPDRRGAKCAPNKLVNDLKKNKNVNFCLVREEAYIPAIATPDGDVIARSLHKLHEQNNRLRISSKQQQEEILALRNRQAVLETELTRSRHPGDGYVLTDGPMPNPDPFRHDSIQRNLINQQWRPTTPEVFPSPRTATAEHIHRPASAGPPCTSYPEKIVTDVPAPDSSYVYQDYSRSENVNRIQRAPRPREKNPRSQQKEAKDKLRKKQHDRAPSPSPDKSPNIVLREAKRRLLRLEAEARAVEMEYRRFRQGHRNGGTKTTKELGRSNTDIHKNKSRQKLENTVYYEESIRKYNKSVKPLRNEYPERDIDKYINEYTRDIGPTFKNKSTTERNIKPIPYVYSQVNKDQEKTNNYLETPLNEFRKLYNSHEYKRHESKPVDTLDAYANKNLVKRVKNKDEDYTIVVDNTNGVYVDNTGWVQEESMQDMIDIIRNDAETCEESILNVEVTDVKEETNANLESDNLVIQIESSLNSKVIDVDPKEEELTSNTANNNNEVEPVTIVITPRKSTAEDDQHKDLKEQIVEQDHRDDNSDRVESIFRSERKDRSSNSKDEVEESEKGDFDYPDDFSADVDNFRSGGNQSPLSLNRTLDDDNFWDS